jgi:hypothetical protein
MTLLLLIAAATGAWAEDTYTVQFKANGKTKTVENVTLPHTFTSVNNQGNGELDLIINDLYNQSEGWCVETPTVSGNSNVTAGLEDGSYNQYITISAPFEGNATVSGSHFYDNPISSFTYTLEISIPGYIDVPAVTINDTKTEASFKMPQYDVDASYTLKRDMSVDMPVTVQDAEQNSRFRVKKQGDTFVPADMNMEQIVALFTVHDDIEEKNLTANTDFTVQLFAVDEEGQKTGEAIPFNDFTFAPGKYVATAVAAEGSNYSGTTIQSNVFELFQGYELTIAAGEYATFYKDEKLYVEDEDAVLYTVANVTDTEAQLSDAIKVAPAETPLLVYNKSEQDKTFLLIPTTNDADEVTPAKEFKGSITSGELPASSSTADYYALNGKAFVWVKYAIAIGANKCWLQISNQPAAARAMTRSIVGGNGTTGINAIGQFDDLQSDYYDLNGRKLQGKPNKKGIYIHNGKKVVVR